MNVSKFAKPFCDYTVSHYSNQSSTPNALMTNIMLKIDPFKEKGMQWLLDARTVMNDWEARFVSPSPPCLGNFAPCIGPAARCRYWSQHIGNGRDVYVRSGDQTKIQLWRGIVCVHSLMRIRVMHLHNCRHPGYEAYMGGGAAINVDVVNAVFGYDRPPFRCRSMFPVHVVYRLPHRAECIGVPTLLPAAQHAVHG